MKNLSIMAVFCCCFFKAKAESMTLNNSKQVFEDFAGMEVAIDGSSEIHLTSTTPLEDAKVNLVGDDEWLYLDNVRATKIDEDFLKNIKVDGAPAVVNDNLRLQIFKQGTVLIPNGISQARKALTAYTKRNCQGESKTYGMYDEQGDETFNTDLGEGFDNNIRSFKLRKGFMAVIANNPDGTGHSRCFIADKDDLIVNELPDGFVTKDGSDKSFVSFIRITKWERVSKKGWAGSDPNAINLTNSTCYLGWDAGSLNKSVAAEYTPMRHHVGWPGFAEIKNAVNVSHMMSYNDADNHNDFGEWEYPDNGIKEWQEHLRTGLRLGSPNMCSAYGTWLTQFLNTADSLNYRVDFVCIDNYTHRDNIDPE